MEGGEGHFMGLYKRKKTQLYCVSHRILRGEKLSPPMMESTRPLEGNLQRTEFGRARLKW